MSAPLSEAESAIGRTLHRRAVLVDCVGISTGILGVGGIGAALLILLGPLVGWLLIGGAMLVALGVAIMRRETQVPPALVPRAVRVPHGPDEDTAPGQPYAPARSIADGAPRSPLSGM